MIRRVIHAAHAGSRSRWAAALVVGLLAVLAAACGPAASPTAAPTAAPLRSLSRLSGQLVLAGPCLRVQPGGGAASRLLVFPTGFTASVSGGTIQVSDWVNRKQFLWQPGDGVDLGGDAYDQLDAELLRTVQATMREHGHSRVVFHAFSGNGMV